MSDENRPMILDVLNSLFYGMFIFSLFMVTKPLAYLVDVTGRKDDVKFLEGIE